MDFGVFSDSMRSALGIGFEPARKAAMDLLVAGYHLDDAAGLSDEQVTADAADGTPEGAAATAENKDAAAYAAGFLTPPGPRDDAPDGDTVAYPHQVLESARTQSDLDALEAQINKALGRAAT
jgi:hypothetical protein